MKPLVSIVVTARNDNHGGDLLNRMRMFLHSLQQQCTRNKLSAELILVEWNPVVGKPTLAEALDWPTPDEWFSIRIVTVPTFVHRRFLYADALPLYQMIAKNVGIRRAHGEYILATNIDILFSEELVQWMASGNMQRDAEYRVDRFDVDMPVPSVIDSQQLLEQCQQNLLRHHQRNGSRNLRTGDWMEIFPEEGQIPRERLHTNGCGDFALTHRDNWFKTRGYPELDTFSLHIDSLWCFQAHFSGAKEVFLEPPQAIFHLEHTGGWTPEVEKSGSLYQNLEKRKIPRISTQLCNGFMFRMTRLHEQVVFNEADWGMINIPLPEQELTSTRAVTTQKTVAPIRKTTADPIRLSLVIVNRNDDHGGNLLLRTRTFLDTWRMVAEAEQLRSEIVMVEWNPPPDRARLKEEIGWKNSEWVDLRIVTVENAIHNMLENSQRIPLYQMIGKNVGIRRARGEWVLATCVDVLFNRPLVKLLRDAKLDPNAFYRMDRYDISQPAIPDVLALDERFAFCEEHLIRRHTIGKTYHTENGEEIARLSKDLNFDTEQLLRSGENLPLHTNACGDFTLLHRKSWQLLRGYPEVPLWSIYIDGLLLHAALGKGLRQVVLSDPLRMYHIEHRGSWSVDASEEKTPVRLQYERQYAPWCQALLQPGAPDVNPVDWGWQSIELPELTLQ
ncbi:MAG: hypothetical protein OEM52_07280 [bacterium]|nr:hypothetical protein [bacterium]